MEGRAMIQTAYRCEICGTESRTPKGWIAIQCADSKLSVYKWSPDVAEFPEMLHYCGEAHAQVYISRWMESPCA